MVRLTRIHRQGPIALTALEPTISRLRSTFALPIELQRVLSRADYVPPFGCRCRALAEYLVDMHLSDPRKRRPCSCAVSHVWRPTTHPTRRRACYRPDLLSQRAYTHCDLNLVLLPYAKVQSAR